MLLLLLLLLLVRPINEVFLRINFFISPTLSPQVGRTGARSGSRNFGKGGPVRGQSPKPSAEGACAGGGLGASQKILKS